MTRPSAPADGCARTRADAREGGGGAPRRQEGNRLRCDDGARLPPPTSVPMRPRVPTLEEAETTLRAAMKGVECDADAVLAAELFLEALATGHQAHEVRPDELHITNESLPVCEDSHLPDPNVATTPEEAEAMPEPPPGTECDASRGGTLELCEGGHIKCVMIGEYTGPP